MPTATLTQEDTASTTSKNATLRLRGAAASARSKKYTQPTFASKEDERKYQKERLAASFRIFSKLGFDEGVAGHITVRDAINPHAFWVNPYGVAFDLMTVSDLLLIDHDGNVLEGSGKPGDGQIYNAAGFAIHGAVHAMRPDVHAAAHSHTTFGRAFSVLGRNVDIASHDAAQFADTVRLYDNFGGIVLDDEEGRNICKALGPDGKGVILRNHGILTAAQSVDAAVAYFVRLEQLCESQLLSDALGSPTSINQEDIAAVFAAHGGEDEAFFQAQEMFEWIEQETGGDYKL
ncbi:class II aldolase/adducin domain protein [Naematelia encephala]|uniref:Class II aldolase/adducin domain protein n=1 Tax=Naematelia encephala TaxID=71784 RepID=A0A1Y2APM8_9TREE|nr:class II aldolase/adducin domain protein [Naematelia encephala]